MIPLKKLGFEDKRKKKCSGRGSQHPYDWGIKSPHVAVSVPPQKEVLCHHFGFLECSHSWLTSVSRMIAAALDSYMMAVESVNFQIHS